MTSPSTILVTGAAGFIGSHVAERLLAQGHAVTGIDNFDPFYSPAVKRARLARLAEHSGFTAVEVDLRDAEALEAALAEPFDTIVHLAAKAGVRPSIQNPLVYHAVNVGGTQALLELAKKWETRQFVFASSSSVYGVNPSVPWREDAEGLQPISPYAASKVSGELLGHVYSHLYDIRFVGLRFFTVYGPRQRPDLAINKFARLMRAGQPIPVFGTGQTRRDYTFVEDIVDGILRAMQYTDSPYEILNLGGGNPVTLDAMITALEGALGVEAVRKHLPEQPGDVPQTWASIDKAQRLLGYAPKTGLNEGMAAFANWLVHSDEAVYLR